MAQTYNRKKDLTMALVLHSQCSMTSDILGPAKYYADTDALQNTSIKTQEQLNDNKFFRPIGLANA